MDKKRIKNYLIVFAVVLITVGIVFYVNEWITAYKEIKMPQSPLIGNISEINSNELSLSLSEMNNAILYVGYNGDDNVRMFEIKLLRKIKNSNNNVIYYNVTDSLENNGYLSTLKSSLKNFNNVNYKAPMLIYLKNNEVVDVKDSSEKMLDIEDYNYLIKTYSLE